MFHKPRIIEIYTEEIFTSKNRNSPKLISCRKLFSSSSLDLPEHGSFQAIQNQGQGSPLPIQSVDPYNLRRGLSVRLTTLLKGALLDFLMLLS